MSVSAMPADCLTDISRIQHIIPKVFFFLLISWKLINIWSWIWYLKSISLFRLSKFDLNQSIETIEKNYTDLFARNIEQTTSGNTYKQYNIVIER